MSTADEIALAEITNARAEIVLEKVAGTAEPDINDFEAVISQVSRMDTVSKLQYRDYKYTINMTTPVMVAPDVYFQLLPHDEKRPARTAYRLHTDAGSMSTIKQYITACRREYVMQRKNLLGDEIYYFDQITTKDAAPANVLTFDMKVFTTSRTFRNVFFEQRDEVEQRTRHFLSNREWYTARGIPYTLGFLLTGPPGVGKTSTIKAIANETRRHVFNVRLGDIRTNTQLKALFQNPLVHVLNPETLKVEKFVVPISLRLFVIEDIDCMSDLIMRREYKYAAAASDNARAVARVPRTVSTAGARVAAPAANDRSNELDDAEELHAHLQHELLGEVEQEAEAEREAERQDRITLDTLLNIFDGTCEIPDRMFCITTNHVEVIDPALIRPGRVDMIVRFRECTREIVRQMCASFYARAIADADVAAVRDHKLTPATVNQVLFKHAADPAAAIAELAALSNKRNAYRKADDAARTTTKKAARTPSIDSGASTPAASPRHAAAGTAASNVGAAAPNAEAAAPKVRRRRTAAHIKN